eukprot:scaffold57770_cov63-Attheya_sp.AAC.1
MSILGSGCRRHVCVSHLPDKHRIGARIDQWGGDLFMPRCNLTVSCLWYISYMRYMLSRKYDFFIIRRKCIVAWHALSKRTLLWASIIQKDSLLQANRTDKANSAYFDPTLVANRGQDHSLGYICGLRYV